MATEYYTKQEALNKQTNDKLFCRDIMHENKVIKRFILTSYDHIYNQLIKNKESYYYENIESSDQVKLHFDIDFIINKKMNDPTIYLKTLVILCVNLYNKILNNVYKICDPKIIVLDASTDKKLSAHIIYTNVHFKSIKHLKEFVFLVNKDKRDANNIDCSIYRVGCFRTMLSSKLGKTNPLLYKRGFSYNDNTEQKLKFLDSLITNIAKDSCLININIIPQKIISVKQNNKITDIKIKKLQNIKYDDILKDAKECMKLMDNCRAENYKSWNIIGLALYNISQSMEAFLIFNDFSKRSKKYTRNECVRQWNNYKNNNSNASLNILKYYAKKDNPILINNIKFSNIRNTRINLYESIKCEYDYIIDINKTITEQKDTNIIANKTLKWINNSHIKTLALNSTYNTGKTSYLGSIIKENSKQFERILFISYRKSLTYDLIHNFEKYDFCSYENGIYNVNRIVCQVESLHYLIDDYDNTINTYDLIIIDEVCSVLNHFMSYTVNNPEVVFSFITTLIEQASKLIVLDGDFSNREYEFIKPFGKSIIIENTITKNIKNYNFINNVNYFDDKLATDLKSGKNVLLISMSAKIANQYYDTFSEYKRVVYCGNTDDKIKDELRNVEKSWIKYQLVIYTGCIESGVNFNLPHFYNQYIILCANSVSPRGLSQMNCRVRQFQSYDVNVFINKLNIDTDVTLYEFEEVYEYIMYVKKTKNITKKTHYDIINTYNHVEKNNKSAKLFIPQFLKICDIKKHTYNFVDSINTNKLNKPVSKTQIDILNEIEFISPATSKEIHNKICKSKASSLEKNLYEKYNYAIIWNIYNESKDYKLVQFDKDFFNNFYGKTNILLNLRNLLGINNTKIHPVYDHNKVSIYDFNSIENRGKLKVIKEIIKMLGFYQDGEIIVDSKIIDYDTMKKNIENIIGESTFFTDKNAQLFFTKDTKRLEGIIKNFKKNTIYGRIIQYINSVILLEYGVYVNTNIKSTTINKKTKNIHTYILSYLKNINNYI